MTYPGFIFWIVAIWAMASRGPALYYLFFVCWSLGTLAVIPPQIAIGNLTPAWIVACLVTAKIIMEVGPRRYFGALLDFRRFGFLGLCTLYATASAFLLPRFFEGQVDVVEVRLLKTPNATPLEPNGANINQAMYFVITTLVVVNVYFICQDRVKRQQFLKAFGWGAAVAIITGLMDLVASKAGLSGLLAPFRNATYVLMLDNDAMNMHRIVGLQSEASAYAGLCLPFLSLMVVMPDGAGAPWGRWRIPISIILMVMVYLSTSSSGYVSLGAVGGVLVLSIFMGMLAGRKQAWLGGYGILIFITLAPAAALFAPDIIASLYHVIDLMVLHKTSSSSYAERSMWNRVAFEAFLKTHELGAGMGAARASSWMFALLSNIGLPGTGLLVIYMGQAFLTPAADRRDRSLALAAKLGLLPSLFIVSLSATSVGFGLGAATLFGMCSGLAWPERNPQRPAPKPAAAPASAPPPDADAQLELPWPPPAGHPFLQDRVPAPSIVGRALALVDHKAVTPAEELIVQAYHLVGYSPSRDRRYMKTNRDLRARHPEVVADILAAIEAAGGRVRRNDDNDLLQVNDEFSLSIVIVRCRVGLTGQKRWKVRLDQGLQPDITVVARMKPDNILVQDYYFLPWLDIGAAPAKNASPQDGLLLEAYRFDTLDAFLSLVRHRRQWTRSRPILLESAAR